MNYYVHNAQRSCSVLYYFVLDLKVSRLTFLAQSCFVGMYVEYNVS